MNFKEKDLNPILFAIASKSLEGLKALVNKFGKLLRQSLKGTEEKYIFQIKENQYEFDSIGLALLVER